LGFYGSLPLNTIYLHKTCAHGSRENLYDRYTAKKRGKTRGRPFKPGNPGRPKGARNRETLAAEALLDGEAEALTRRAIERALSGDILALKICLDRVLPPRQERAVLLDLPDFRTRGDAGEASAAILGAVANGKITPGEATELAKLLAAHMAALEVSERYETSAEMFPALDTLLGRSTRSVDDK
jgi:hypothetical protein